MSSRVSPPAFLVYCSQREARVRYIQPHQLSGVPWEDVTLIGGGPLNVYPPMVLLGHCTEPGLRAEATMPPGQSRAMAPRYLPVAPNAASCASSVLPATETVWRLAISRANEPVCLWALALGKQHLSHSPVSTWGVSANSCLCIHGKSFPYIFLNLATTLDTIWNNTIRNNSTIADIFKSSELLDLKCTSYCVYSNSHIILISYLSQ